MENLFSIWSIEFKPMDILEYSLNLTVQLPQTLKEINNKDDLRLKVEKLILNLIERSY